ncbi:MAG: hypothetical protein NUK65_10205, partial [Firmicutes bacterium]|nr:hypothetical protein [Bacillota bacterium]
AQDLIGTEVEQVPHTLVVHLLDQRIIVVDGTSYRIHVKTMVVAVKVSFILNCELVDVQDGD